jgi:hypothetical protein
MLDKTAMPPLDKEMVGGIGRSRCPLDKHKYPSSSEFFA